MGGRDRIGKDVRDVFLDERMDLEASRHAGGTPRRARTRAMISAGVVSIPFPSSMSLQSASRCASNARFRSGSSLLMQASALRGVGGRGGVRRGGGVFGRTDEGGT